MVDSPNKMNLEQSIRYVEGLHEMDDFNLFRQWAMTATASELLARINRPITPKFGVVVDEEV